jgi:ABC-type branched-subunit amino acid transport system substrate-binding protein
VRKTASPAVPLLFGIVIGLLIAGLVVPLVAGDTRTSRTSTVRGPLAATSSGTNAGAPGDTAAESNVAPGASADVAAPGTTREGSGTSVASGGASGTAAAASKRAAAGPTVYDQGVTDKSIKVGFLLYDLAGAGQAGFNQTGLDPKQQRAAFEAYVDEVNKSGGINGRRIEAVYKTFDLLSEDGQRSVCLSMLEDEKVFALVGQFFFRSAYLCATREHHRVVLALGSTATGPDVYAASAGMLFTAFPEGDRMMSNFATELQGAGMLKGATVGILSDDGFDPGATTTNVLAARIKELGGKVGRHSHLSADLSSGSAQIPVQLQQMRSAGVNLVLLAANPVLSTQFVHEANTQQYAVKYAGSDWAAMSSQPGQANMPASYNGTKSFTGLRIYEERAGIPDTPRAIHCRKVYEAYNHQKLNRDSTPWGVAMGNCNFVDFFARAAAKAENNLNSRGLSQALQNLGRVEVAQWGDGSFRPGKFGFFDSIRPQHWDSPCSCTVPDGPMHPTKY